MQFQSTHPRRVWLSRNYFKSVISRFNPHTHAGCDSHWGIPYLPFSVSIHTPTQGVTYAPRVFGRWLSVSIHTPTQGVTWAIGFDPIQSQFQSTHPRRVWQQQLQQDLHWSGVSIHTPTQGVTYSISCNRKNLLCFNPHTHAGCDQLQRDWQEKMWGFNPHTHAGCDYLEVNITQ